MFVKHVTAHDSLLCQHSGGCEAHRSMHLQGLRRAEGFDTMFSNYIFKQRQLDTRVLQEIERLTDAIKKGQQELEGKEVTCVELRQRRAELQPEVSKLLKCHADIEEQQRAEEVELKPFLPELHRSKQALSSDVRLPGLESSHDINGAPFNHTLGSLHELAVPFEPENCCT